MGSDYEVLDPRFERLINPMAKVERIATGGRWAEGPVHFPAGRYLLWSDVAEDCILRYDETDGHVSVFRRPSSIANGNTIDRQGRLITCEHRTRRVTRTEHDGSITTIAERWHGRRLNSPNDVVVKSDGTIWFTDPSYGIADDYLGRRAVSEIDTCNVYRVDPTSGELTMTADDFVRPNGLAFSPDESKLYVVDSGRTLGPEFPAHMRVFDVNAGNRLSGGQVFADCTAGVFDGLRIDATGHLWVSSAEGIHCYEPGGGLIGKVRVPEVVSNCSFGGPLRNRLFITATTSLYAVYLTTNGVPVIATAVA
jgi:gluconolactonase